MTLAESSAGPVLNPELPAEDSALSAQLYFMLVMLCREAALTRVIHAGVGQGLEAWRVAVAHHEPPSRGRHAGPLLVLLSFSFEGDVSGRIEVFDREAARYEASSGEAFPENVRMGVLMRQLPEGGLRQHLVLNSSRLTTWQALKLEVESVRRAQRPSRSGRIQ